MNIKINSLQFLTKEPTRILTATSATAAGVSYAVWHTAPDPDTATDEAIFLTRISDQGAYPQKLLVGADPDCLPTSSGGYLSWITKDLATDLWTVNLSTFDRDAKIQTTSIIANDVSGLVTRPYLAEYDEMPCLVYCRHFGSGRVEIHTHFLGTGKKLVDDMSFSAENMIVKWSARQLVAVIETKDSLEVLSLRDDRWQAVTKITKERFNRYDRWDFGVGDRSILFVAEVEDKSRLASFVVDLSTGATGEFWPFCEYGKFPQVAAANGQWLVSWAGGPASSLEQQGKLHDPEFFLSYMRAREQISAQIDQTHPNKRRSEIEEIWDTAFVPIWAPLWLGLLNEDGKCIATYGPLGDGNENWGLQLSVRGGRGVLLWSSAEEVEDEDVGYLKAREIVLQTP
jgi:hypothetical protein